MQPPQSPTRFRPTRSQSNRWSLSLADTVKFFQAATASFRGVHPDRLKEVASFQKREHSQEERDAPYTWGEAQRQLPRSNLPPEGIRIQARKSATHRQWG